MYRTIDTAFWTDPKMRKLDKDGKLLCLYLVTNSHSHVGGIYYIPDEIITLETGIEKKTLNTLWHTLSSVGFCRRDKKIDVVWVIKMFFYQGRGEKNQRAVANHLDNLHNSFLVNEFCTTYPIVNQFRKHRVSIGYPAQGQSGIQDQEQEQEQEQEQDTPIAPKGANSYPSCFDLWWEQYPKTHRVGKATAYRSYQKAGKKLTDRGMKKSHAVEFLRLKAIEFATSPKGNSEYVPNPATWLNQGRYDDDPAAWQQNANGQPNKKTLDQTLTELLCNE